MKRKCVQWSGVMLVVTGFACGGSSSTPVGTAGSGGYHGYGGTNGYTPPTALPDAGSPMLTSLSVSGQVTARSGRAPSTANTLVLWTVNATSSSSSSSGSTYSYKFGDGSMSSNQYTLQLNQVPPQDALNQGGYGVGVVLLVPSSTTTADGKLTSSQLKTLKSKAIGGTERYAIVYKSSNTTGTGTTPPSWLSAFPYGYSCGQGIASSGSSSTSSGFQVTPCTGVELILDTYANLSFVKWK